jgi:hypothetical protein
MRADLIWELIRKASLAIQTVFNPPKDATSGQVRLYGAAAWFVGLFTAFVGTVVISLLSQLGVGPRFAILAVIFHLAGFGFMMIGGYRALTGNNEQLTMDLTEVSILRVINGLFALLASFVIAGAAATALLYYLQWMGIDPRNIFKAL